MTPFREWPDRAPFEMMVNGGGTRHGVKIPDFEYWVQGKQKQKANAFFFDVYGLECVAHNKNVQHPRPMQGRLARTHDGTSVIVRRIHGDQYVGVGYVTTGAETLDKSQFTLIQVDIGERREEIEVMLDLITKSRTKTDDFLKTLQNILLE